MKTQLKQFQPDEIKISKEEAKKVLMFFFGKQTPETKNIDITNNDIAFAQALLTEAIDASVGMNFFQTVFEAHPSISLKSVIFTFAKAAASQWFRNKDVQKDPKIYDCIRATLAGKFKGAWQARVDNDEDILY
jgi:hypothetical protein